MNSMFEPKVRPLVFTTPLRGSGQMIVAAPASSRGKAAAERLADRLRFYTDVTVLDDPPEEAMLDAAGPVIVIGNLADSRCVKYLYFQYFCATDRWYPGPGGFEVRTLLNPLGTGHNLVHVGYSDDAGLTDGMAVLERELAEPLPYLSEISATRLPIPDNEVRKILHGVPAQFDWQVSNRFDDVMTGYLGYLTGDRDLIERYCDMWQIVIDCGYEKNEKIVQTHIFMWSRVVMWRLLEQAGMIPERMRRPIVQFVYEWAGSGEGWRQVDKHAYQTPHFPRHNHATIAALGLVYTADYFRRHDPECKEVSLWQQFADGVFSPYVNGSWKPYCDGLCHGWWMTGPTVLDYGLMDPQQRFFRNGGARLAAECAVAVVNNAGWMPSAGDSDMLGAFPGFNLRAAAAYYGDGTYHYVHAMAPEYRRLYPMWGVIPALRTFDTGLEPVKPADHIGIKVIALDPLIREAWKHEPELANDAYGPEPEDNALPAKHSRYFDKIAIRTGWDFDDDYLLLDGLGGKKTPHSYSDAMCVHDYARFGVSCIVTEDLIFFPEPESHSLVTITRDGVAGFIPCFAELESAQTDPEGNSYVRMRLNGYSGADWIREVLVQKGCCAVFHDTVIAREAGAYSLEAHFRTPAGAALDDNVLTSARRSETVGSVEFRLTSHCTDDAVCSVEEVPVSLNYRNHPGEPQPLSPEDDVVVAWQRRYNAEDVCLTAFKARCAVDLQEGESVSFTHLAQIRGPGERVYRLESASGSYALLDGDVRIPLPLLEPGAAKGARGDSGRNSIMKAPVSADLRHETYLEFASAVTGFQWVDNDRVLCALEDGTLRMMEASERGAARQWELRLGGPIHDFSAVRQGDRELIFAGHGRDRLSAIDGLSGELVWEQTIVREPCPWPWWELPYPVPVQVAAGVFADRVRVAVGCGDIQMRLYDADGRQQWMWRYNEGVPGRIRLADVNGDGVDEIIVGGDVSSDQSTCRMLTHEGEMLAELSVEYWTSRMTALTWSRSGQWLVCGASRGNNLHLFERVSKAGGPPPAPLEYRKRLIARLGGNVTSAALDETARTVYAGTSQGFLLAYDFAGQQQWTRLFATGIAHVLVDGSGYVGVYENDGRCHLLDGNGETYAASASRLPGRAFEQKAESLYISSGTGICRIALPKKG